MDIIYLKEITSFNEALMNIYSENCSFDSSKAQIFIKYLIDFIKKSNETTIQGLTQNLQFFAELLTKSIQKNINLKSKTNLLFKSICEIFFAFLNKNYPKEIDINLIKKKLIDLGDEFLEYLSQTLEMIIGSSKKIIKNGANFIVFGHSVLIENILTKMASKSIRFSVIIPENRPSCEGYEMCNRLAKNNISTKLIVDSALAIYIDEADFILSGAEAVVENGGIINGIGTYSLALIAYAKKKPFYVMSESFKFSRMFPLSQKDIRKEISNEEEFYSFNGKTINENVEIINPLTDYTSPELITLLVTDKGIFTPSAVSDELIQMFGK